MACMYACKWTKKETQIILYWTREKQGRLELEKIDILCYNLILSVLKQIIISRKHWNVNYTVQFTI